MNRERPARSRFFFPSPRRGELCAAPDADALINTNAKDAKDAKKPKKNLCPFAIIAFFACFASAFPTSSASASGPALRLTRRVNDARARIAFYFVFAFAVPGFTRVHCSSRVVPPARLPTLNQVSPSMRHLNEWEAFLMPSKSSPVPYSIVSV